jgi:hypothetical protein
MIENSSDVAPRAPLSPDRRATPASVDLVALCHSLPADGHLSNQDLEALREWKSRYGDVRLPSNKYVADVVEKALTNHLIPSDERQWVYNALEPALPVQLRKETQERRLLAELAAAERERASVAVISFDFLVAGVHLEERWRIIESRVHVGDPVSLERSSDRKPGDDTLHVILSTRECIGLVPEDEGRQISQELDYGARVEAVVRKILTDGQYPVPVIGSRVYCVAVDDVEPRTEPSPRKFFVGPVPSLTPTSTRQILMPVQKPPTSKLSISKLLTAKASPPNPSPPKALLPQASIPTASTRKPSVEKASLREPPVSNSSVSKWPTAKLIVTVVAGLAGGALIVLTLLTR